MKNAFVSLLRPLEIRPGSNEDCLRKNFGDCVTA
jgi:hypothetical protein